MKKNWIWIAVTITLLGLGLVIAGLYLSKKWKPILEEKLNEQIAASSDGLYTLGYQEMNTNLLTGSVSLTNATLEADTSVYARLLSSGQAPKLYFNGHLEHLDIRGIGLWSLLVNKKLNISRLELQGLHLKAQQSSATKDRLSAEGDESLYDQIKDKLNQVSIKRIQTKDLNFQLIPVETSSADTLTLEHLGFTGEDLLISEQSARDSSRIYYMKQIDLRLPGFQYDIPGSVYTACFGNLHYSSKTGKAELNQVQLLPRISKLDYFQQDSENKALIVLKWEQVILEKLHAQAWQHNGLIWAERVSIKNGSAEFFKDKRYQKDTVSKIGEAPHQQIMRMKQSLRIDTIWVEGVDILYQQHSDQYPAEGQISFVGTNGFISNLSNDSAQLSRDRFMRANLQTSIMASGPLHAMFGFDMLSTAGKHSFKGSLGKMQAPAFNRILRPLLNFEIESGDLERIEFDIQANDRHHRGEFRFDYSNLGINILRAPDDAGKRSRKGILSFLTSNILINDSNPDANGEYHIAHVDYTRVPTYSHFKSIWKSLQDGIVECIGINPKYVPDI
ncbi:MAG: hypothetical protein ACTIKD_08635 [Sphingobacteriaceae bacterium]